jgi:NADPH:quinone reductase-like Zn-dependent oxidoreductase
MQIVTLKSARPIGLYRRNPPTGVSDAIDTSRDDVKVRVDELTNGEGVNVIIDTVGDQHLFEKASSIGEKV